MVARHVLVVDDEPAIRGVLALALESEGYTVTTAANGQEALHELHRRVPDAAVVDLMMSMMTGRELIAACRADPATADLPIIAISAVYAGQMADDLGVRVFLEKPFDLDQLLDVLDHVIRHSTSCPPAVRR
jgi:CheY-like chemotaxis protein